MRIWVILPLMLNQGCGSEHKTPPELADCGSLGCRPFVGSSQSGSTGGGGSLDADSGIGLSLAVSAVAFAGGASDSRTWSLSTVTPVSETIEVQAQSVTGATLTNSGASPVVLTGVSLGAYAWASARPTSKSSTYLPGMVSVANWKSEQVNVPLLRSDDLSFVAGLYTMATLSLDSARAQVAIKIVDAQGNGVKNARVRNPGADTVAYANQGTWIDMSLEPFTDSSGRVVFVNVPAAAQPGGLVSIVAYGESVAGAQVTTTAAFPIEAGFVSYGTIVLNLG